MNIILCYSVATLLDCVNEYIPLLWWPTFEDAEMVAFIFLNVWKQRLYTWIYSPSLVTYFRRCRDGCFYISECVKAKAIYMQGSVSAVILQPKQCVWELDLTCAGILLCLEAVQTPSVWFVGLTITCLQVYFCALDSVQTFIVWF